MVTNCKDWSSSNEQFQGGGDYIIWFKTRNKFASIFNWGDKLLFEAKIQDGANCVIDILERWVVGELCNSLEDLVKETEVNQ